MTPVLTATTRYGGTCPSCRTWRVYRPLPPRRGHAWPPRLPEMTVTCGQCGARVTLTADAGQDPRQPLVLARDDLDLSGLRAHCREHHASAALRGQGRRGAGMPRSNRDLAAWHYRQHHRYGARGHRHGGPWVMVRDVRGRTVGQIARPLGWYTGQDVVTAEEDRAAWAARHPRSP
jgi:hypothetical protein